MVMSGALHEQRMYEPATCEIAIYLEVWGDANSTIVYISSPCPIQSFVHCHGSAVFFLGSD